MQFTSFEIASASSSVNRLRGAVDTARAGDLLVTADAGNKRVSVYDFAAGTYSEILPPEGVRDFVPRFVATDGTTVAAATEKTVYTCAYTGDAMRFRAEATVESAIRGIACVYGSVYYVTGNAYGKAGGDEVFHDAYGSPAALTSDVYGDLFVAYDSLDVVRFTESEFLTESGGEKLNGALPQDYASLRADFEGNLYCVAGDKLLKNGEPILTFASAAEFVYRGAGMPCAFALGYEDSEIYLLYGDYLVKTAPLKEIPTLDAIDAGGVFGDVFKPHETEGLVLDIPRDTVGVRVDLGEMQKSDPENFPYLAYYRTAEETRGVLLASKDGYALVVLYEVETASRTFTAALFRLNTVTPVPTEEYFREETGTRYLSSAVSSYYYPCLHSALAGERLARGTRVEVKGIVSMPERDYALVSTGEGFGYIPAAYLTDVRPIPEDTGVYEPAWLKESKEGVTFTADGGEELTVYERTRVDLTKNENGTYTARLAKDGKVYRATVSEKMVDRGESDALRISLIVILFVLAVGIIGCYVWYYPRKDPIDEMPKNG